jgi:tagatose-1,6-bisphosphate aldolase non-catalytic subunit AgaZ/GatZ
MRQPRTLIAVLVAVLIAAALLVSGCSASKSAPPESPQAAALNAALAKASTSVGDASTYIIGLKQPLPGSPSNDDLQRLQTTVNAASSQTGAAQQASAQSALDQFNAGIIKVKQVYDTAPAGSPEQEQLKQLIATLEVGRDALAQALK